MKKKNDITFLSRLKDKFRLIVMNDNTLEERISIRFSALEMLSLFSFGGVLSFVFFLLLFGYTPMNEFIPGKASGHLHRELIAITLKTDSLEKNLLENELYLENISAIVNGKDPIAIQTERPPTNNPLEGELSFRKSKEDSLLRISVEAEDKISITPKKDKKNLDLENILFFSPIKGVITNGFDTKKDHFGTDIVAKEDEPIKCVFDGVVVIGHWTSETGYVIGVQHPNGVFSLYKHNSILFKSVGEYVKSGEVLAVIGNSGELSSGPHLHFELWHQGIAVNPENYISF